MGASSLRNELGACAVGIVTAFPTETAILNTTAVLSYPTRSATGEHAGHFTELGDRCDGNSGIGKSNGFHRDTRPRQGKEFLWRHAWLCLDARGRFCRRLRFEWNQTQDFRGSGPCAAIPYSAGLGGCGYFGNGESATGQRDRF